MDLYRNRKQIGRDGCAILTTVFLGLLFPLFFIVAARLSVACHATPLQHPNERLLPFVTKALLGFGLLMTVVALIGGERTNLPVACFLLSSILVLIGSGINWAVKVKLEIHTAGRVIEVRRLFLALGLHESTASWRRIAVKPVVGEAISGGGGLWWTEKVVAAVAFGSVWWWKVRGETEALAVLPWVTATDGGGRILYCMTMWIGVVRAFKALFATWILVKVKSCKLKGNVEDCTAIANLRVVQEVF